MQSGRSYVKDSGDFLKKIKNLGSFPQNAILVTADVVGLYPSISHEARLRTLEEPLENRNHKKFLLTNTLKNKNDFFKFKSVFHRISGTAIGTKFALPYAYIVFSWTLNV